VRSAKQVNKLIPLLLPHSLIKKPIMLKLLIFPIARWGNQYAGPDKVRLLKAAEIVDYVHMFNQSKNRKFKWT
jgi:hypothetical protein